MQIFLFVWFVNFGISLLGAYFKNLALKLRIYNFRDVCVCICPPHLPSPYTKHLPFIPSIILPLPLFMYLPECLRLCLLSTFRLYFLYSIHCLSFYGSYIPIVFKIGSTVLQRTIYDPILRAILIPKYTYFHPQNLKIFHF
jgi:hypothetical protein